MQKAKKKSPTFFERMEREEFRKPAEDLELNPLRALQSDPGFVRKYLVGAPNLKAVAALLKGEKPRK